MKLFKSKFKELILILLIAVAVEAPIFLCGNLPGLYQDALMPDYLAVQFFNPLEYQVTVEVSYPFLTQIYHGALSAYISFLGVLLCGGKTSVLQHHLIFSIMIIIDCIIINLIILELQVKRYRRWLYVISVACMSSLMIACFTQYYIELPGTVSLLVAVLLMVRIIKYGEKRNELFWIFILLGISFFNYFNYIFFLPAFLMALVYYGKSRNNVLFYFARALAGFFCGSLFYILGFSKRFFRYHTDFWEEQNLIVRLSILMIIAIAVIVNALSLNYYAKKHMKRAVLSFTICMLQIIVYAYMALTVMIGFSKFDAAIEAASNNLFYKIAISFGLLFKTMTCNKIESFMYGSSIGVSELIYFVILLAIIVTNVLVKKSECFIWFKGFVIVLFSYVICTVVFSSGMHEQHYIPCIFIFLFIVFTGIENIIAAIDSVHIRRLILMAFIIFIGVNIYEKCEFTYITRTNGGVGLYSPVINDIAYEANDRLAVGYKDIYIFPEWGMVTGFDYLTGNKICFSLSDSEEDITEYIQKGYNINICVFDSSDGESWIKKYKKVAEKNNKKILEHCYFNMHNEQEAIRLELSDAF